MTCPSRLFTRPKAEREDGAASGWGHSQRHLWKSVRIFS